MLCFIEQNIFFLRIMINANVSIPVIVKIVKNGIE